MQPTSERTAIAAIGPTLNPQTLASVYELYRGEQAQFAALQPAAATDVAYGEHPRQGLDLYDPKRLPAPVLLWVHGGGFVRGEKASTAHPFNAHVGRWAARNGMLGAVMNYRLAPQASWPGGGEDVVAASMWLRSNAAAHGGDPARIVVMGTSAGSTHIATALRIAPDLPVRAAILLSGLYGFTPLDERDMLYYGAAEHYYKRMPRAAMIATELPLMLACAEFDPPRFHAETLGLLGARTERRGRMDRAYVASGHNHFSLACHLGGKDTRLGDEILAFIEETCG